MVGVCVLGNVGVTLALQIRDLKQKCKEKKKRKKVESIRVIPVMETTLQL